MQKIMAIRAKSGFREGFQRPFTLLSTAKSRAVYRFFITGNGRSGRPEAINTALF